MLIVEEVPLERKKEKIKILHVLGSMNMGGIQMFLMNIMRNIDNEEIQLILHV